MLQFLSGVVATQLVHRVRGQFVWLGDDRDAGRRMPLFRLFENPRVFRLFRLFRLFRVYRLFREY